MKKKKTVYNKDFQKLCFSKTGRINHRFPKRLLIVCPLPNFQNQHCFFERVKFFWYHFLPFMLHVWDEYKILRRSFIFSSMHWVYNDVLMSFNYYLSTYELGNWNILWMKTDELVTILYRFSENTAHKLQLQCAFTFC
jgi:hypothetical protein